MLFQNRTAVISGSASGIGLLTAQKLAEQGAYVILADVNIVAAETAAEGIRNAGGQADAYQVDVRHYDEVKAVIDSTIRRQGRIDILINCAGGCSTRIFGLRETFKDLDISVIDWGIDVNLKGPVYFAHAAIGHMMENKSGVIINLGSVEGQTGSLAIDYCTSKSGIMHGFTKSLALYGAPHNVRVCCVSPGPVLTRPAMAKMKTALGRAAEPQEIVDMILYLCSDKAAFITGTNYLIDGGRSCGARD
jgi:3-oxoacyl-[acyl-carrier protein] reductase